MATLSAASPARAGLSARVVLGFIVVPACALAALGYMTFAKRSVAAAEPVRADVTSAQAAELANMKQRMDLMQLQMLSMQQQQSPEPTAAPRDEGAAVASARARPSLEEEHAQIAETHRRLEQRFTEQPLRSEWASNTEQALRSTLQQLGSEIGRQVSSLECKGDTCRMATEHASREEAMAFMDELSVRPGLNEARYVRVRTKPGEESYVFFVQPRVPRDSVGRRQE